MKILYFMQYLFAVLGQIFGVRQIFQRIENKCNTTNDSPMVQTVNEWQILALQFNMSFSASFTTAASGDFEPTETDFLAESVNAKTTEDTRRECIWL